MAIGRKKVKAFSSIFIGIHCRKWTNTAEMGISLNTNCAIRYILMLYAIGDQVHDGYRYNV